MGKSVSRRDVMDGAAFAAVSHPDASAAESNVHGLGADTQTCKNDRYW